MDGELLQKILKCQSLPSLPAVAAQVIELTGDPNVNFNELTSAIQQDQGLSSKILKTVNSSFYGLRQRCATIQKAIVLLGLSPVKTLALSFSLVSALEMKDPDRFDHKNYWRRSLYSATAAKLIADEVGLGDRADEAFLGALLQDIGMMAMHRALGEMYLRVIDKTSGDHRQLVKHELEELDLQHSDVGALLADRWKLPAELMLPIKYHERPTASPPDHTMTVRCVGLGNIIHDVLTDDDPTSALSQLYKRAEGWFKIKPSRADEIVESCAEKVKELAAIFTLETGDAPDTTSILAQAQERREELAIAESAPVSGDSPMESLLIDTDETEAMTGLFTRVGFEGVLRSAFNLSKVKRGGVSAVVIAIEGQARKFPAGNQAARDELNAAIARLLSKNFRAVSGACGRLGADIYAIVADSIDEKMIQAGCKAFRDGIPGVSAEIGKRHGFDGECDASVGFASVDFRESGSISVPQQLLAGAMKATQQARGENADRIQKFGSRLAA